MHGESITAMRAGGAEDREELAPARGALTGVLFGAALWLAIAGIAALCIGAL
jgi:hypothetical protein